MSGLNGRAFAYARAHGEWLLGIATGLLLGLGVALAIVVLVARPWEDVYASPPPNVVKIIHKQDQRAAESRAYAKQRESATSTDR